MAEHESKNMDSEFVKCPKCGKMVEKKRVAKMRYVCYECNAYFRVSTRERIRMVADKDSFEPWFEDMPISNPLQNEDYEAKIEEVRATEISPLLSSFSMKHLQSVRQRYLENQLYLESVMQDFSWVVWAML